MFLIGIDDTDTLESRGTGHLARQIAAALAADYPVLGVTRHQLLVDPRVPCTRNNSSAAIALDVNGRLAPVVLLERVRALMLADYQPGSDPGLCVARDVPAAITEFGRRAQRQLVAQDEARALAVYYAIPLMGLGGDQGGVIGALAAVGLAASGEDGRYVQVGRSRELSGLRPVPAVLAAGGVFRLSGREAVGTRAPGSRSSFTCHRRRSSAALTSCRPSRRRWRCCGRWPVFSGSFRRSGRTTSSRSRGSWSRIARVGPRRRRAPAPFRHREREGVRVSGRSAPPFVGVLAHLGNQVRFLFSPLFISWGRGEFLM
jgi:hypothetical protein